VRLAQQPTAQQAGDQRQAQQPACFLDR
jgi:hypothetical protein